MKKKSRQMLVGFMLFMFTFSPTVAMGKDNVKPNISNVTVSPIYANGTKAITVRFKVSEKSKVKLGIYNGKKLVKSNLQNVSKAGYITWTWGGIKADGTYVIKIDAVDYSGNKATTKTQSVFIDSVKPTIVNLKTENEVFNPELSNDKIIFELSEDAKVIVKAKDDSINQVIKTLNGVKGTNSFEWDGKLGGKEAEDGSYTFEVEAIDKAGNSSIKKTVTIAVDSQGPVVKTHGFSKASFNPAIEEDEFSFEVNEQVAANLSLYDTDNKLIFSSDFNKEFKDRGTVTWKGKTLLDIIAQSGEYSYKLTLTDKAKNKSEVTGKVVVSGGVPVFIDFFPPVISNLNVPTVFSPVVKNEADISFTLSEDAKVTAQVFNESGTLVKTILKDEAKIAGNILVKWDGKDNFNVPVIDGDYIIKLDAKDAFENKATQVTSAIKLDKTPPAIDGVANEGSYNSDRTISFTEGTVTLNGQAINSGEVVTEEKDYVLEARDNVGNQSVIRFKIDRSIIRATASVDIAEASKTQEDLDAAKTLVDALPNVEAKTGLQARLDDLQEYIDYQANVTKATEAVVKAEGSKAQTDVDAAKALVNELHDSDKVGLLERLAAVQAEINYQKALADAEAAVVKAEESKTEADVDSGFSLVNALKDADKQRLQARLKTIQDYIAYQNKLAEAKAAVTSAENSILQTDVDKALEIVNQLESKDQTDLLARLEVVKKAIEYQGKVAAATEAVIKAEGSKTQENVDAALVLVSDLAEADQAALIERIETVKKDINYQKFLADAETAVKTAEESKSQVDLDNAEVSVKKLNVEDQGPFNDRIRNLKTLIYAIDLVIKAEETKLDADIKVAYDYLEMVRANDRVELLDRLRAVEKYAQYQKQLADAETAVVEAEGSKKQEDVDTAKTLVNALNENDKTRLLDRLKVVETDIDYQKQLAEAEAAVVKAEESKTQDDVDKAAVLVNALKLEDKNALEDRLNKVRAAIKYQIELANAEAAVAKAEESKIQADVDSAKTLVNALSDEDKTKLLEKLTAVEAYIGYQKQLADAETAVNKAEEIKTQDNVNKAAALVSELKPEDKTAFEDRLNKVQDFINYQIALANAEAAVTKAETTNSQVNVNEAVDLINELNEADKPAFIVRLEAVQLKIDTGLRDAAINSVTKAEETKVQSDVDIAQAAVKNIPERFNADKLSLQARLDAVEKIIQIETSILKASEAIEKADKTDLQADLNTAKELVNQIPDREAKTTLLAKIDTIQGQIYQIAEDAVIKAEKEILQVYVDNARKLVDVLPEGDKRDNLLARINYVQDEVTAISSVKKAEITVTPEDVNAAKNKVKALENGLLKTDLLSKIDSVQSIIDNAVNAVNTVEETLNQLDQDKALSIVNVLPDSDFKKELLEKLQVSQVNIYLKAANAAVADAQFTKAQESVDKARAAVQLLPDSETKTSLLNKIEIVQQQINERIALVEATDAVEKAETSILGKDLFSQLNLDGAKLKVLALVDGEAKKQLLIRIDTLQAQVNKLAVDLTTQAEASNDQTDVNNAYKLVNTLTNLELKSSLLVKLNAVQSYIDYQKQLAEAEAAVVKAVENKTQATVDAALNLVKALKEADQTKFLDKIKLVQEYIDYQKQLTNAQAAVEKAVNSIAQTDVDAAKVLVDALKTEDQTALREKLISVQAKIDYQKDVANADIYVSKAEASKLQGDVDAARIIVNKLADSDAKTQLSKRLDTVQNLIEIEKALALAEDAVEKAELSVAQKYVDDARERIKLVVDPLKRYEFQERIDTIQATIDKELNIITATELVVKAEETQNQADVNAANNIIAILPSGEAKKLLQIRIDKVQSLIVEKADAAVTKAEETKVQEDVDSANKLVATLPSGADKTALQERLNKVQNAINYQIALTAVTKAEETKIQADVNDASKLVAALPEGPEKTTLQGRLDQVQGDINFGIAKTAVEKAETVKNLETYEAADKLVKALPDGEGKTSLLTRLKVVKDSIDYQVAVKAAETAVNEAAETMQRADVEKAQLLIEFLPNGDDKTNLTNRLNQIRIAITNLENYNAAIEAVVKAETNKIQGDVLAAKTLVKALPDDTEGKATLLERLAKIQGEIDYQTAADSVAKAETSKQQADVDYASALVKALPDGANKTELIDRINAVQTEITYAINLANAKEAVKAAQQSNLQTDVYKAQELIAILPDNQAKNDLLAAIKVVQDGIDYDKAVNYVIAAEKTKLQTDLDTAKTAVANLPLSPDRLELEAKIEAVQIYINEQLAIVTATSAVHKAEETKTIEDLNIAKDLVNKLPASEAKNQLLERIKAIVVVELPPS